MSRAIPQSLATKLTNGAAASILLWIPRTLLSWLIVYPLIMAIQSSGMVSGPDGESVLFRPGSLLLLELLRVAAPALGSALKVGLVLGVLAVIAELLPLACALDLLWVAGGTLGARIRRAIAIFPRFLWLGGVSLLAQAALLLGASLLGGALKSALEKHDERLLNVAPLAVLGLALLACTCLGAVLDIGRAALIQEDLTAREALMRALACLRGRPSAVLFGLYASIAASASAHLGAAWFMTRLDLSTPANGAIAWAGVAHQVAVLFALGWRVRWLDRALELSAEASALSQ